MPSIFKIIRDLILVVVFVALSIFSLIEYRADNINVNMNNDKLSLSKNTFAGLSYLMAYLEKMPTIRLLPVFTKGVEYQKNLLNNVSQEQIDLLINNSNNKEEISEKVRVTKNNLAEIKNNLSENLNFRNLIKQLKEQLSKDWFRS